MSRFEIELRQLQDTDYRAFQCRLMPTVNPETVIGVRTPQLRALAKQLWQRRHSECEAFLQELPHMYYEENNLHAFLLMQEKQFSVCLERIELFLPYIDNWATCDSLMPPVFKKQAEELLPRIEDWLSSKHIYTCRFGIGCLLSLFLDERYRPEYLRWVAELRSSEYYVNMMIAWYFSEALVKQYEEAVVYLRECRLERWTHNKAIQKAVESFRISDEKKQVLKAMRRKKEE